MVKDTSASARIFGFFAHTAIFFVLIVTLFPVIHILSISLSSNSAVMQQTVTLFPQQLSFRAYEVVLESPVLPFSFKNSVFYTFLGTTINIFATSTMAYALAKRRLLFRGFFTTVVVICFFFGGGLIPTFLVVRSLGLYNTVWALALPGAISVWNLIMLRTFFQAIPQELEDSAFVDGANDLTIFTRIAIPVSKAAIATFTLFYAVGHWNSWFPAVIYFSDLRKMPMQVVLRQIIIFGEVMETMFADGDLTSSQQALEDLMRDEEQYVTLDRLKYAVLFITMVPMLVLYPFIQKYFVRGIMIGSLKG